MKNLTRPSKPRKYDAGKKLTESGQMSHRWKEYCEELYSEKQENVDIGVQEREPPLVKEEIKRPMLKPVQKRAPAPDNIAVEFLDLV